VNAPERAFGRIVLPSTSPAPIVWITGLSGTGKTTLANAVCDQLATEGVRALLLDGDAVRHALDSPEDLARHGYDARVRRAWRLARLARIAANQGFPVIVATISLLHAVQAWNRAGASVYCEVLLSADIDVLKRRDPGLYVHEGADAANVVGIDIVPEFPLRPELVLEQRFVDSDLPVHAHQVVEQLAALVTPAARRA